MKARFWDRLAKSFDKDAAVDPILMNLFKDNVSSESVVLELGAGTGALALNLARFCRSLEASDFSAEMIARAKEKEKPENLNFTIQDASNLSYKNESFDLIIAIFVLHVVPDMQAVIAEAKRVLKPGGKLIAEVPIPKKQGIISAILNGVMRLMKFRLWTAKKYETMLQEHGFSVELNHDRSSDGKSIILIATLKT
ncbi:class I SAM-dependent methyltransferase [Listeria grandensis]|uniref:Class I SAM-dependent methyltransferase n=1 Tax=Listeria grandensis TaxID=1494963 RepID=A0A7X1CNG9_9LIST|nr:class I SAM-dependent methyltransferase [Listeria grandensis]MBC1473030.1 class I SAM-dependent methyltransferase [Listeria grandensis]MBC1934975.1 class I SAM-dependent methyltransferase [Listeria grandensis]